MMWWGDGGWVGGSRMSMTLMMVGIVLFWAAMVALGAWVMRSLRRADPSARESRPSAPAPSPRAVSSARAEELLAERFARGEIDETQFRRSRDVLHTPAGPDAP